MLCFCFAISTNMKDLTPKKKQTNTNAYTYTHIHTHTHTYIQTDAFINSLCIYLSFAAARKHYDALCIAHNMCDYLFYCFCARVCSVKDNTGKSVKSVGVSSRTSNDGGGVSRDRGATISEDTSNNTGMDRPLKKKSKHNKNATSHDSLKGGGGGGGGGAGVHRSTIGSASENTNEHIRCKLYCKCLFFFVSVCVCVCVLYHKKHAVCFFVFLFFFVCLQKYNTLKYKTI